MSFNATLIEAGKVEIEYKSLVEASMDTKAKIGLLLKLSAKRNLPYKLFNYLESYLIK